MPIANEIQIPVSLQKEFVAYNQFDEPTGSNRLVGLSKLNVIIGQNNSGKSRLLRELYSEKALAVSGNSGQTLRDLQDTFLGMIRKRLPLGEELERFRRQLELCHPRLRTLAGAEVGKERQSVPEPESLDSLRQRSPDKFTDAFKDESKEFAKNLRDIKNHLRADSRPFDEKPESVLRIYVPTLRGLRSPSTEKNFYHDRTAKDYFSHMGSLKGDQKISEVTLLTGLEMFSEIQRHLLGTPEERRLIRDYERFLSEIFFRNKEITLMPRINSDVLHLKIGEEPELPIYNLGDGLQHLLIITLPLFIHREKRLMLFIEEPELFLHPGFQRTLIDTFLDRSGDQHQIFVATHSHQFLDITIDRTRCSIYRCRKTEPQTGDSGGAMFHVHLSANDDFPILRELGIRNSSVLLSNCTIWVEGITDRKYYRHFLHLYQRTLAPSEPRFLEDLHFSFVEFGGGNITHWSFLDEENGIRVDRLCGHAFVISDRDTSNKKQKRHDELKRALGDRFYLLTCVEVENLLTPEAIVAVVESYEGELPDLNPFEQKDYQDIGLGAFIQERVLPNGKSNRTSKSGSPYADSSGTIKAKVEFCDRAILKMQSFDELSLEAKKMAAKLYAFILKQNS